MVKINKRKWRISAFAFLPPSTGKRGNKNNKKLFFVHHFRNYWPQLQMTKLRHHSSLSYQRVIVRGRNCRNLTGRANELHYSFTILKWVSRFEVRSVVIIFEDLGRFSNPRLRKTHVDLKPKLQSYSKWTIGQELFGQKRSGHFLLSHRVPNKLFIILQLIK